MTIQVVRALTDPAFWSTLGFHGQNSLNLDQSDAANLLKCAVEFKAAKIPEDFRSQLTLLLDATDIPALSMAEVVDAFDREHGEWLREQGFDTVWVVGPLREMVRLLGRAKS
jgi:hypothetical protein